jgi:hypothetical protein
MSSNNKFKEKLSLEEIQKRLLKVTISNNKSIKVIKSSLIFMCAIVFVSFVFALFIINQLLI